MRERPERVQERFPLVHEPPFKLDGTRCFLFVLPCDHARLEALLQRTFGWASSWLTVEPVGSTCLLMLTDVARASARDPALGHFRYREATFFVPVWGQRSGTPFSALHVPFIYPDRGLAVAAGREIYGLPKKPATIAMPQDDVFWQGNAPIAVRCLAAERFDGSAWIDRTLLTVTAQPQSLVARAVDALLDLIDDLVGPLPGPLGPLSRVLMQDLVQLKQVPDVAPGGPPPHTLYRAVTRVQAPVRALSNVRLGDSDKVRVHLEELASEPVRDVLGLPHEVTPVLAASLDMDFALDEGEVWSEEPETVVPSGPRTRVLILGGGMAGLAAAHALTDTEARRARFDVTVLAQGHLLGGKGASTRNPDRADRIEEHGIHVIFGFYHNLLRLMRGVFQELGRPHHVDPTTFDEAFTPRWEVVFHDGTDHYKVRFPQTPEGYGAGPMSVHQQLMAAGTLVQSIFGGGLADMLGGVIPGLGNPVAGQVLAFVLTLLRGVFHDIVLGGQSWEDLDGQDFRAWMHSHRIAGLPDLRDTAIMQVPYDGVFAYEGADQSQPRLSAGIAARGLLKLVSDYERAVLFDMSTGMGEAVFAPLHELLRARGVHVELFTRVKQVHIDGTRVGKVTIARQAEVIGGADAYEPLVQVGDVRAWRHAPDLSQLTSPAPIAGQDPYSDAVSAQAGADIDLADGTDFDWVICALPAPVTASVLTGHAGHPALSRIANVPTVATLHLQTWLSDDLPSLGWPWGPVVLGGFRQPLNSVQDNTRLLRVEGWPPVGAPRTLLYASGPFGGGWSTDPEDPAARAAAASVAHDEARLFIRDHYPTLLPATARADGTFDFQALHAPWTPGDPLADQHVRHNIDRSSRYCFLVPGGLADRPRPEVDGIENLSLAGDWTRNGIDIPCMEGTVVSALLAAAAVHGEDPDILW